MPNMLDYCSEKCNMLTMRWKSNHHFQEDEIYGEPSAFWSHRYSRGGEPSMRLDFHGWTHLENNAVAALKPSAEPRAVVLYCS